jgi:hypothetical protein
VSSSFAHLNFRSLLQLRRRRPTGVHCRCRRGTSCARDAGSTGASHIQRATYRDQTGELDGIIWSFCCFFFRYFGDCNVDHLSTVQHAQCICLLSLVNECSPSLVISRTYLITTNFVVCTCIYGSIRSMAKDQLHNLVIHERTIYIIYCTLVFQTSGCDTRMTEE